MKKHKYKDTREENIIKVNFDKIKWRTGGKEVNKMAKRLHTGVSVGGKLR